ncbi:MAG: DUF1176 domain-containing protein [Sphingomonas adhaesiva]|uniref:DUF1176 domain-containing protein n=1 Tax=Sphingomonas adhaesiva TaxID=28212 RepID=UPI002FF5D5BB
MSRVVMAALLLAACGAQPAPPPSPAASPSATPIAAPRDSNARPAPAEPRTFGDWAVACDNGLRCEMASLGAEGGGFPTWTMALSRGAGPAGAYEIALDSLNDDKGTPATIVIDGRRHAVAGNGLSGPAAATIAGALATGRALTLHDAAGTTLATVSLKGASAALRFIDAAQGRAGTVTATVATGPAAAVPPAPPLPTVVAITPGGTAASPSVPQWGDMRRVAQCDDRMSESDGWKPRLHALGGGATLILLPCSAGAYNEIDALFVLRDGKVTPAQVDAPSGFAPDAQEATAPVRSVINGSFDGGLLGSYGKARGLGDCGIAQSFAWDGARFRLTEQKVMSECRGNPHYLTVWRAKVVRR